MYDFVSESFNRNNSYEYKLSIQVSLNGFSFCIQKEDENDLLALKQTDFVISGEHLLSRRFRDWYSEEELLSLPFKNSEILVNSKNFSLLPEQLESVNLKKTINELLPGEKEEEYAEGWIKSIKAKLIYQLPPGLAKTVHELVGECRLIHPMQKLIGYQKRSSFNNLALLYLDEKDLYLVLKKDGELVLSNYFRINHTNDAIYFLLTTIQQLGLSLKEVVVQTCGKASYLEHLSATLPKYFRQVSLLLPKNSTDSQISQEILAKNLCLY